MTCEECKKVLTRPYNPKDYKTEEAATAHLEQCQKCQHWIAVERNIENRGKTPSIH